MIDPTIRDQIEKLHKHLCPSCDLSDSDWAEREGYNKAVADVLVLVAAIPQQDWQPIETAPKDGTLILVSQLSRHTVRPECRLAGYEPHWRWLSLPGRIEVRPTHWMPLPPPPSVTPEPR